MSEKNENSVFINGKAQIIEMLQIMDFKEREKLLRNITSKNRQLASELMERSVSFRELSHLSQHEIYLVIQHINPAILGVALKGSSQQEQKKILSLIPRNYAEQAYHSLVGKLTNETRDVKRAQDKIVSIIGSLIKKKQILS